MKFIVFFKRMLTYLKTGQLDLFLYSITKNLPGRLVVYNKAVIIRTARINIPEGLNNSINVRQTTPEDVDHIIRVTGWNYEYAVYLQNSRVVFFLASLPESKPSGFTALCTGHCYVRGMGFEYSFDKDESYWFAIIVLPEDRRKGIYLKISEAVGQYIENNHIRQHYALIEFTNERSLALHYKMGFRDFLKLTFIKIGYLKISRTMELSTGKKSLRIFFKEPKENVIII